MRQLFLTLLLIMFCHCAALSAQTELPQYNASLLDSRNIKIKYGDINQDGSINIFDLLSILRQISVSGSAEPSSDLNNDGKTNVFDLLVFFRQYPLLGQATVEEFRVIVSIGNARLTEPVVYSFSPFNDNNQVSDTYKIFSNLNVERIEFVFGKDTLTGTEGTTPVFFAADPDTLHWDSTKPMPVSDSIAWRIRVWDNSGNYAADSGVSRFQVLMPEVSIDGPYSNSGEEIEFPLILHGAWQRFGITAYNYHEQAVDTFVVDLNVTGCDSIVYESIEQLSEQIMQQVAGNDSFWHSTDVFGSAQPSVFISAAISQHTKLKSNRLILVNQSLGGTVKVISLHGNTKLPSAIGYPLWIQNIPLRTGDYNFIIDPDVPEKYR